MSTFEIMKSANQHDATIKWAFAKDGLAISHMMVCHSAAGYYPGRMCFDAECGFIEPYSRAKEYGYFATEKGAQDAIDDMVF